MSQPLTADDRATHGVVFRPVRGGNTFEETVERLLCAIKLGFIAQGETLPPERDLAAQLGISRVTLREAIRALQQAGYVEPRRGRYGGTFVTYSPAEPSEGEVRRIAESMGAELSDALAFRRVIEPGAAALTAERALAAKDRQFLQARLEDVRSADATTYRLMDSRFHLAIAEMSGSPSLYASVAETRLRLNDLLNAIPLMERNIEHSHEQHNDILLAILRGDARTARSVMEDHVAGTAALLRGFLG
ncbi:FadR/GntR family transcriptional regulator [Streptomyces sp. NPDC004111]|uniref:FadR/GntR family transcriptional regulator n=1 Tax=Streptomyces sp. NPDC004111 TaxID=3364690 RepID=UPI0036824CC3